MNQAVDVADVLDALKIERADVVAHDIGNMVAFAMAEKYPERVTQLVVIDAPIPGNRAMGRDPEEPTALAFPLRRPRHGTTGEGTRAHLP